VTWLRHLSADANDDRRYPAETDEHCGHRQHLQDPWQCARRPGVVVVGGDRSDRSARCGEQLSESGTRQEGGRRVETLPQ